MPKQNDTESAGKTKKLSEEPSKKQWADLEEKSLFCRAVYELRWFLRPNDREVCWLSSRVSVPRRGLERPVSAAPSALGAG
jgi:hypothetical protein